MKLKIATRIFNEEYFIKDFSNYYINYGIDEIHFFDSGSTDKTLKIIKQIQDKTRNQVILAWSDKKYRHTSYLKQTEICNLILNYAINNFIDQKEEVIWIFPDIDEFVRFSDNIYIKDFRNDLLRTVFIEWYLPPNLMKNKIKPLEMLNYAKSGKIKGKMLDLWGDPFYKDYIVHISSKNVNKIKKLKNVSGFHRLIFEQKLLLPINNNYIVVNHLRGVPFNIMKGRIDKCLNLLENNEDEWSFQHFFHLEHLIENYEEFYRKSLKNSDQIEENLNNIKKFKNSSSYFNNVIMKDNLIKLGYSKPSMHNDF